MSGGMHGRRLLTIPAWPWVSSKKCFQEQQRRKFLIKSSTTERIMKDALRSEYLQVLQCFFGYEESNQVSKYYEICMLKMCFCYKKRHK